MGDTDFDTDTEGATVSDFPDDGKTQAERDEELKTAMEEKDYQTRMRHLRKRMNRSTQEYEELKKKVADMKDRFRTPMPDPKICPQPEFEPPPELKLRKFPPPMSFMGEDEEEALNAGGDGSRRNMSAIR